MSSFPARTIISPAIHPVHVVGSLLPPSTSVTYSFWVPEFVIHNTRSLIDDTDFATLGAVVTAADGTQVAQYGPTTVSLGDVDNGTHALNMHIAGIPVPEGGSVAVAFTILNKGSSKAADDIDKALNEFGNSILQALLGGGMNKGAAGSAGGSGILALSGWEAALAKALGPLVLQGIEDLLADCDGLVVTESLTLSEGELAARAGQAPWTWSTEYKGTNSADGCGANSDYTVSYSVMASPPCVTVPNLVGAEPGKVAGMLSPLGLTGEVRSTSKAIVDEPQVADQDPLPGMIVMPSTVVEYDVHVPEGGARPLP
jgi:hypothetical protein